MLAMFTPCSSYSLFSILVQSALAMPLRGMPTVVHSRVRAGGDGVNCGVSTDMRVGECGGSVCVRSLATVSAYARISSSGISCCGWSGCNVMVW
jgi:hypothetical protein